MPAFDAAKVLSSNPRVRAANSYQAVLDYMQGGLSAANYTTFLANLVAAGLPNNSDDVLNLAEPGRIVEAAQAMAFNYISSFPINPTTISTVPQSVTELTVGDRLTVAGAMEINGTAYFGGSLTIASNFQLLAGTLTFNNNLLVEGAVTLDSGVSVRVGGSSLPSIPDGLAAAGAVQGAYLRLTEQQDPSAMGAGDLFEDDNGDLIYHSVQSPSREIPLTRPKHDTGWIGVQSVPSPGALPDIYSDSGIMTVEANPGDPGGPTRIVVWLKVDQALVDGLSPATGLYYYFNIPAASSLSNVFTGIEVQIDGATGGVEVILPASGNPILPLSDVDVDADPEPEFRVMIWTR